MATQPRPRVGDYLPSSASLVVTQEMLDDWAVISDDFNPIHVDEEFSRTTRFGSTIAHGSWTIAFLMQMMTGWAGKNWRCGGRLRDIRFVKPVRPGDTVTARGMVAAICQEGLTSTIECDVWLENQAGERTAVGTAKVALVI